MSCFFPLSLFLSPIHSAFHCGSLHFSPNIWPEPSSLCLIRCNSFSLLLLRLVVSFGLFRLFNWYCFTLYFLTVAVFDATCGLSSSFTLLSTFLLISYILSKLSFGHSFLKLLIMHFTLWLTSLLNSMIITSGLLFHLVACFIR